MPGKKSCGRNRIEQLSARCEQGGTEKIAAGDGMIHTQGRISWFARLGGHFGNTPLLFGVERVTALFEEFILQAQAVVVGFDRADGFGNRGDPELNVCVA